MRMIPPLYKAESQEELKSLLMKVKEESEKVGSRLNIQKTKIMESGPITSWQIDGEKNGNSDRLYFLGLQNHCRWQLQPWSLMMLAPWKKIYDQPRQHIKKQRHYFATKVRPVKAMVFPVIMYGCERWNIKLSTEELMLLNCSVGKDSGESLGLQGDPTSPS